MILAALVSSDAFLEKDGMHLDSGETPEKLQVIGTVLDEWQ